MQTVTETAHILLAEDFVTASTESRGLSACFLIDLTTGVAGSEEESVSSHHSEWPGDSSEAGQR